MKNVKKGHTQPIVCLDAGHAGKYNRSDIVPEFYESDVNWKLHNLLGQKLESYGIKVIKTREDQGKDSELTARGKMAKGCDLSISIHVNAADNPNANYVLGVHMVDDNCGIIDEQSNEIAKLLADCVADVMGTNAQVWTKQSSGDRDGNGYKDDYYGILRGAHSVGTAGVIIEHGFYTNKKQAQFLLDDNNLLKIADAEAKVIADYFGAKQKVKAITAKLPVLKPGDRGEMVKTMQILLEGHGYKLSKGATGNFGNSTKSSLKQFKKDRGLKVSDLCGKRTWAALLRL